MHMLPARVLNFRPNPDHRRTPIEMLAEKLGWAAMAAPPFTPVSWDSIAGIALDQGGHGACEGHSHSKGLRMALQIAGTPLAWDPSPDGLYKIARCIERNGRKVALTDSGTESAYICMGINLWGVHPMGGPVQDPDDSGPRNSDVNNTSVNAEPTYVELEKDSESLFIGQYSAEGTSAATRLAAVNLALSKGYMPTIGGDVDSAYMGWEPSDGVYPGCNPKDIQGGHSQLIIANRISIVNSAEYDYQILNSWGPWCDRGRVWVRQKFILDAMEITAMSVRRAS